MTGVALRMTGAALRPFDRLRPFDKLRVSGGAQNDRGRDLPLGVSVTIVANGEQGRGPDGRAGCFGGLGGKSGLHGQGAG